MGRTTISADRTPVVPLAGEQGSFVPSVVLLWGREAQMSLPMEGEGHGVTVSGQVLLDSSVGGRKGHIWGISGAEGRKWASNFSRSRISQGLMVLGSRKLDIISGEHFLSRKEELIPSARFPTNGTRGFLRKQSRCVQPHVFVKPGVCDRSCPPGSPLGAHRTGERV